MSTTIYPRLPSLSSINTSSVSSSLSSSRNPQEVTSAGELHGRRLSSSSHGGITRPENKNSSITICQHNRSNTLRQRKVHTAPALSTPIPLTEEQRWTALRLEIDDINYAQLVADSSVTEFFNKYIQEKIINSENIFRPLVGNENLNKVLWNAGFKPKTDEHGTVKPGVFFNALTHSTIQVSSRKTMKGDTEWNLFFKGVDPFDIHTIWSAGKNIAGVKNIKSFYKEANKFVNSSISSSSRNKTTQMPIKKENILELSKSEKYNNAMTFKALNNKTHDIYDGAAAITKAFVELAKNNRGENLNDIVVTLSGHSMGGGLAQTGLAACPDDIDKIIIFQAMDSTDKNTVHDIKNKKLAIKIRDVHVAKDVVTGYLKYIRNLDIIKKLSKEQHEMRRTVHFKPKGNFLTKLTGVNLDVHNKFYKYLITDTENNEGYKKLQHNFL